MTHHERLIQARADLGRPKRILLDCDGVLADFIGPVLALVADATDRIHTREDVDRFDFAAALNLTPAEKRAVTAPISDRDGWWSRLPVFPGARAGVDRLREIADVYIVTSPWNSCRTWHHEREGWLRHHFDLPASRLVVTSAKHVCAGDVLVDDRTETLVQWRAANPAGRAVQWTTPHNRNDGWDGFATSSWSELVEWCS